MKKIFVLASLVSSGFATAQATDWSQLLTPSDAQQAKLCSEATQIESLPRTSDDQKKAYNEQRDLARTGLVVEDVRAMSSDPMMKFQALVDSIRFQSPGASTYNICGNAAQRLEPQPKVFTSSILVYIGGRARELKEARDFNAVLVLSDKEGNELQRIQPHNSVKGDTDWWKASCSSNPCKWLGENIYYFRIDDSAKPLLAKTDSIKILFTRGNGVEQRSYSLENFKAGYLKD